MRILLVGNGAREHALAWAISASPLCDALFCAPGNAGIANLATCIDIPADAVERLVEFARGERIDFVIVGPEAPLVLGLVDALEAAGVKAFGPSAKAAQLEGSKGFMKDLCARHTIPTAPYARFSEAAAAKNYVDRHGAPIVVKADGLAAGKGVTIAQTKDEAFAAIEEAFGGRFGAAGSSLVIEGFLDGEEVSFFALVDGKTALPLASAQDHKRVGDGDTGPNTGGMGAYSPAPIMTDSLTARVMAEIIEPTVAGMAAEGMPFKGVLFAGLMILDTADGKVPYLLEYNTRFGDPECEVLMRRLKSDLLPALVAARDGVLDHFHLRWHDEAALCVVMAGKGYPGTPKKGGVISNLAAAEAVEGVTVFHAGTKFDEQGRVIADGGRVLCVTATGRDVREAQTRAYQAVDLIAWDDGFCRRDIGWRALAREA
jgi:phosphoribosylamine--glycine ligase